MNVNVLIPADSWMMEYANVFINQLETTECVVKFIHRAEDIDSAVMTFFLSCDQVASNNLLKKNKYNILVHG